MYIGSDSGKIVTLKELREIIKDLPDETVLLCEDGNYDYVPIERVNLSRHVALGAGSDRSGAFPTEDTLNNEEEWKIYRDNYGSRDLFELKHPILCFGLTPALIKPGKQE